MPRILRALGAVVVTFAVLAPVAAEAGHWTSPDAAGDVEGEHFDPAPEPCGTSTELDGAAEANTDITRVIFRHARRSLFVKMRFRDLDPALEQWVSLYFRTPRGGWWLDVDRYEARPGKFGVETFLAEEPELPDPDDLGECEGVTIVQTGIPCRIGKEVDLTANVVRVAVPRACLDRPRWLRVAASAARFVEPEDPTDDGFGIFWDEWDGGTSLSEWMPPFGPRVRAPDGARLGRVAEEVSTPSEARRVVVRRGGRFLRP